MTKSLKVDEVQNQPVGIEIDANTQKIKINDDGQAEVIRIGYWQPGAKWNAGILLKNSAHNNVVDLSSYSDQSVSPGVISGGNLRLNNKDGKNTILLDGGKGDITLQNADCAEEFEKSSESGKSISEPGTVMILDNKGKLRPSYKSYDKRVVGVVSGAGGCKPGVVLGKKKLEKNRILLALIGKVYCKADADYSQIKVGDLMTTSPTRGYAMKAGNRSRAFGSVIGKALSPLRAGNGLVPILVALQ